MKKPAFVSEHLYHIYNRGVEKRKVFQDDNDRFRFIHDLFEFNDEAPALNVVYRFNKQSMEVQPQYIEMGRREPRKLLVDILAFCLMPNHYHILVKQRLDGGIVNFMKKLGTGYTMYFNQKYKRVGPLFQGRFKAILVDNESHFIHLPYYIHMNPLDLIMPEWREGTIPDFNKTISFLENYRWSSYLDYIGKKNFPSVTQREFLSNFFESPIKYKQETIRWIKELGADSLKEIDPFSNY